MKPRRDRLVGETGRESRGWRRARPCGGSQRPAPTQAREPCVVAVGRDALAAGFDGERGEPGVLDQVPRRCCRAAKLGEDAPVAITRLDDRAGRLLQENSAERERFLDRARLREDAGVRGDSRELRSQSR